MSDRVSLALDGATRDVGDQMRWTPTRRTETGRGATNGAQNDSDVIRGES